MNDLSSIRRAVRKSFVLLLLFWVSVAAAQYTNGIYAEFNTSMGSFTCRLDYAIAPKAVANFIGLATGQRAWLDLPSGVVRTNPFYDGTIFHRVITNFVNQGGSPNGLGTDGPGYQFVDEFTNAARFDAFGVLAMANSGPDSNGSQYFITTSPQPGLNDVHTIFGRLCGGSNVVYAINRVATGPNDKPLTNVVVQSVVIRRSGLEAQAFDIHAQGLPGVTNLNLQIARAGNGINVIFTNQSNAGSRMYLTTNLLNWSSLNFGYQTSASTVSGLVLGQLAPQQFFKAVQVQYPSSLFVPKNVLGRNLTLNVSGYGTFAISFDVAGGGSYTWSLGAGGTIPGYNWTQDPYRGRFLPLFFSNFPPMSLHLDFDGPTAGTFKGTGYPNYPSTIEAFAVSGTFTASP